MGGGDAGVSVVHQLDVGLRLSEGHDDIRLTVYSHRDLQLNWAPQIKCGQGADKTHPASTHVGVGREGGAVDDDNITVFIRVITREVLRSLAREHAAHTGSGGQSLRPGSLGHRGSTHLRRTGSDPGAPEGESEGKRAGSRRGGGVIRAIGERGGGRGGVTEFSLR